jgi:multiple sugar transport system permease protein
MLADASGIDCARLLGMLGSRSPATNDDSVGGAMSSADRRRLTHWGLNALTYLVLLVMLAPVFWMLASALQTEGQLASGSYDLLSPTFSAFSEMWETVDFERYLANSIVICGGAALFATAFASSAGYALARFRFRGSRAYGLTVIGTQLIPGSLFLLPVFLGFVWLGQNTPIRLLDTHIGMILVYTAFFTPLAIYFMRAFFQAIPRELEEAAMVDGSTRFGAFVRIVLPNATPGLLATFVYAFLFAWDELMFATALTEQDAETIPIGIRNFVGNYSEETDQLMAAGVVSTIPVLVAFFATQRWLVRGLTSGAVKG